MGTMRVFFLAVVLCLSGGAMASGAGRDPLPSLHWPFDGVLGTVDRQAAQRGFQVYKEVCSACHGLHLLSYRQFEAIGFSAAEVKALASQMTVRDGPNDAGEYYDRPGLPSDLIVGPYPNEEAARASNNGAYPPDLSLIIKAREKGADYLHALLMGYTDPPENVKLHPGQYYNRYFEGRAIAMPPPLSDNQVTYADGTEATVDQMARDLVIFLQWAAEPEMEHRKEMGLKVVGYFFLFTIAFYIAKRRIWGRLDRHKE